MDIRLYVMNNKQPSNFYKSYFDLINGKRDYSRETKCAILRAVFYVINADNKITEAEEKLEKARANAKPGSLASKANMVKNFNENK